MKRTPIRRKTRLKSGKPPRRSPRSAVDRFLAEGQTVVGHAVLTRRTRLRAKGGDRFQGKRDDAYRAYIRSLPCTVAGRWVTRDGTERRGADTCFGTIECAHVVKTRGAGAPDVGFCVPLCESHHTQQHAVGIRTFPKRYRIDFDAEAARLGARWARPEGAG